MNNISLRKVRKDNAEEKELFENMYFNFSNSLFSFEPDVSTARKPEEILFELGIIYYPTQEEAKEFEKQCYDGLRENINKAFFIFINDEIKGFITADLSGTRSVLIINEMGFIGNKPEIEEIEAIVNLIAKQFKAIKVVRIMSLCNSNTKSMLKEIGFEECTCCLEKRIGGG